MLTNKQKKVFVVIIFITILALLGSAILPLLTAMQP